MTSNAEKRRPDQDATPSNNCNTASIPLATVDEPEVRDAVILKTERFRNFGSFELEVTVRCPYCDGRHFHGWKDEIPVVDTGSTSSHCLDSSVAGRYRFVYATDGAA